MQAEGAGSEERGDLRDGRKHTDEVPGHKRGGEKKVPVNYDGGPRRGGRTPPRLSAKDGRKTRAEEGTCGRQEEDKQDGDRERRYSFVRAKRQGEEDSAIVFSRQA